jgi:PEP-CTERM motif
MRTKYLLLTLLATTALSISAAHATTILTFGQTGTADTITGTESGGATTIKTDGSFVGVTITQIDAPVLVPVSARFILSATSTGTATTILGQVEQAFTGTFSICGVTCATNYLSGTFADAVFGAGGGLTLTASGEVPGESVTFTSNVIDNTLFTTDRSLSLSFANVAPPVHITDGSLGSFTSGVSGTMSSSVPEPSTWAMMLAGFAGLAYAGLRKGRRTRLAV